MQSEIISSVKANCRQLFRSAGENNILRTVISSDDDIFSVAKGLMQCNAMITKYFVHEKGELL